MKLFISWSGEKSQIVANALRQWIPDVIQIVEPWMSAKDIDAGARWNREIQDRLSETKFGIICLTKNNIESPWILFEAGAIAKTIADTFVCPFLIDLSPSEISQGPLTQFQAKKATEKETWELVCTINKALKEESLPEEKLKRTFERWWPDLKKVMEDLPNEKGKKDTQRPTHEMIEEILNIVRGIARKTSDTDYSTWKAKQLLLLLDEIDKPFDKKIRNYLSHNYQDELKDEKNIGITALLNRFQDNMKEKSLTTSKHIKDHKDKR